MSKLPPLPSATGQYFFGSATSGHWEGLIRESVVREYGQQCHDAALDEAAEHMRQWDFEGLAVEIEGLKK